MPADSIGTQIDPSTLSSTCRELAGASCSSTGIGVCALAASGCSVCAGGTSVFRFSALPACAVNALTRFKVRLFNVSSLRSRVRSYFGRLPDICTSCKPITPATAPKVSASTITAASTDSVCPSPMRRNARTSGRRINRLSMNAKVIGTSTSRAKYNSARNAAVAMIPNARSRTADAGGKAGASDAMRHFGTEAGSSAASSSN